MSTIKDTFSFRSPFSLDHLLLLRFIKNNQICINFKYHLVTKIWGEQKKHPVFLIRNAFNKCK